MNAQMSRILHGNWEGGDINCTSIIVVLAVYKQTALILKGKQYIS